MLKLIGLVICLAAGATGATAWLLAEPDPIIQPEVTPPVDGPTGAARERINLLKERVNAALEEGRKASSATEARIKGQLNAYRGSPDRPPS